MRRSFGFSYINTFYELVLGLPKGEAGLFKKLIYRGDWKWRRYLSFLRRSA